MSDATLSYVVLWSSICLYMVLGFLIRKLFEWENGGKE
jgi:hypothetical protein